MTEYANNNSDQGSGDAPDGATPERGSVPPPLTLRDQVRLATPVHPPSDPVADQRRRSAFLRLLLSQFTGQQYDEPEDPPKADGSRDADSPAKSTGPGWAGGLGFPGVPVANSAAGTHGFDVRGVDFGLGGKPLSTVGPLASPEPLTWDEPLASLGGRRFVMPSVLPTALPPAPQDEPTHSAALNDSALSDATRSHEPGLAGNPRATSQSSAYYDVETPRAPGSAPSAGTTSTFESHTATGFASGPGEATASADPFPSALSDSALSTQLASPAADLPTGLPPQPPEEPRPFFPGLWQLESTRPANERSFGPDSPHAEVATSADASAASPGTTAAEGSEPPSPGSASGGQVSPSGVRGATLSLEIANISQILATATQAAMPGFEAAAREIAEKLSSSVDATSSQMKDLNARFEEHQMNELMKAAQMRAIYG